MYSSDKKMFMLVVCIVKTVWVTGEILIKLVDYFSSMLNLVIRRQGQLRWYSLSTFSRCPHLTGYRNIIVTESIHMVKFKVNHI